jgi:hypothetical protein
MHTNIVAKNVKKSIRIKQVNILLSYRFFGKYKSIETSYIHISPRPCNLGQEVTLCIYSKPRESK